jgi:PAS domain-containing protein
LGVAIALQERRDMPSINQSIVPDLTPIIESTDDAVLAKTFDRIVTYWNPGAEVLYGDPALEVIGGTSRFFSPDSHGFEAR